MLNKGTAFLVLCFMTISTNLWANESTVSCALDKKDCDVVFVPPLPNVSSLGLGTCTVPIAETYTIKNNRSFPVKVGPPKLVPTSPFVTISGSSCGVTSPVELPGGGTCTVTLTFKICAPGTIDIDLVIPVFTHQNELTTPIEINIPVPPALSGLVIAGGEDFSNLAPPFLLVTQDEGTTWDKVQVDPPQLPVGAGNLTMSSCFNSGAGSNICFAFGTNTAGYAIPLKSTDGGTTWSIFNIPEINDVSFTVNGGDCTESGSLCIVVGEGFNEVNATDIPLILQSTDGGSSWSVVPITGVPAGFFNAAACTGSGATAQCIAVGETEPSSGPPTPLLAQTTDGGGSWGVVPITSTQGFFNAASCTESVCIAAGQYRPSTQEPLLAQSINRGAWGIVTSFSPALPSFGEFFGASCTGDNINSGLQCIAVGNSGGVPLIVQGIPDGMGGINWGTVTAPLVTNGNFYAASCTGDNINSDLQCIAVGYDTSVDLAPLLAQSVGVGPWNVITSFSPNPLPTVGLFNTAACTGSGATAQCIAAGLDESTFPGPPLLAQSVNGGSNWSVVSGYSLDTVTNSAFYATSCVGSGSTAQCIAVGQDPTTFEPLLAQSIDDGTDWATVNIAGLSATGLYDKAACTDDNSLCIAPGYLGSSENNNSSPVLLKSVDQGTTWTVVSNFTTSLPALGFLNASTCTGSGADSWCVAVGSDNTNGADFSTSLIVQSTDGGTSWQVISPLSGNGATLNAVSCWGTNTSGQCVAAGVSGERNNNPRTLLLQSFDGSTNWSEVGNATGINGFFEATSCTGNGSNSLCIVTGGNATAPLFASQAGGTWSAKSVTGASNGVLFNGASCIGEDISSVFCIIVGANETSFPPSPVIAQSIGGNSWSVVGVSGTPSQGLYNSASCTGTDASASYCVAVGYSGSMFVNETPLLATNKNNAGWNVISVSDIPPIMRRAQFSDVNCIGGSNSPFCVAVGNVDSNSPLLAQTQGGTSWYVPTIPSLPPAGIFAGVGSESD